MAAYDAFANEYERLVHKRQPVIELSYHRILDTLGTVKDRRILDRGAGDGELGRRLARRGARVEAIDVSPVLIDRARARDSLGLASWQVDDATVFASVSPGVDAVVMNLMLMELNAYVRYSIRPLMS